MAAAYRWPYSSLVVRYFSFSLLIGTFAVLAHLYLYRRLVRKLTDDPRWRRLLGGLLAFMAVLLLLRRPIRALGPRVEHVHELIAYSWLELALSLLVFVLIRDSLTLLALGGLRLRTLVRPSRSDGERALNRIHSDAPHSPATADVDVGRRRFVAQSLHIGILAGGSLTAGYGAFRAFAPPEISEVAVRLPRLPRPLDGLTIVQLTDIHVGSFVETRFVDRLVEMTNELRPDLVAITGDLVDGDVPTLGAAVARLGRLRSRYGTFFVTGNHEYYSGDEPWCAFLQQLGVNVLRNRRVSVGDAGGSLDLVGVDDFSGGRRRGRRGYDLDVATAGRDAGRAAVLMAHQPANFETAATRGMGLQLSGHTHGGQLFPMTALVDLGWKYSRGLYQHDDSHIYVSRGCGFWGPPARIDAPPEIAKIVLTV